MIDKKYKNEYNKLEGEIIMTKIANVKLNSWQLVWVSEKIAHTI